MRIEDWGCNTFQVSSEQLRDDLLSMLVAGHETTGSVLTWTLYLLSKVSFPSLFLSYRLLRYECVLILFFMYLVIFIPVESPHLGESTRRS